MRTFFSFIPLVGLLLSSCLATLSQAADTTNTTSNSTLPSLFISPSGDMAFSLSVPSDPSTSDLYFSLVFPRSVTWAAIGLGSSSRMAGSLMLVAYSSSSGNNVTLSPRLASGHAEPVYTSDIHVEALDGTGLVDNARYVFLGRCANCRSWGGGAGTVDVTSRAQSFLYATGPDGEVGSDAPDAPLKMHLNYGTFTMDMVHATTTTSGAPEIPIGDNSTAEAVATTQGLSVTDKSDGTARAHAVIMVLTFVGFFPFGILVLRLGSWVRWHAVNQGLGLIGVIVGFGLGVHTSYFYNRSKKFNSAHQVIGILLFIFVIAQFALGFMHHRIYKKTQQPTKLAPVHVWMGRVIIPVGVVNAFLGFKLAQSPQYNYVLAGLVVFLFPVMLLILFTKRFISKRWSRQQQAKDGGQGQSQGGYSMEPWQPASTHASDQQPPQNMAQAPDQYGLGQHGAPVGLQHQQQPGANFGYQSSSAYKRPDLGAQQQVREYV